MAEEIDVMFGPDKRTPEGGVSDSEVISALGISMSNPTGTETDNYDRSISARVLKMATPEQKAMARAQMGVPEGMNMGGTMRNMPGYMGGGMMPGYMDGGMMPGYMDGGMMDETLGYTRGGMKEEKRGPIKYSKGGAIKGKNYKGSF